MHKVWDDKCSPNKTLGHNPFLINNMDIAINRIAKAINEREKIVVYGPCNVDGICSISLFMLLFKYLNADIEYYISEDKQQNISSKVIGEHVSMLGASLIISLGCVIESIEQENFIKKLGMEVIALNNCDVKNDFESTLIKYKKGCISTITFKLAQAIAAYYNMKSINKYIDLAMIGIYSGNDGILSGENKVLFDEGIQYILKTNNYGLRALMNYTGINVANEENINNMILVMTPTKNAVGTMDNARIVVELLTTNNKYRAHQIVKYLNKEVNNSLEL